MKLYIAEIIVITLETLLFIYIQNTHNESSLIDRLKSTVFTDYAYLIPLTFIKNFLFIKFINRYDIITSFFANNQSVAIQLVIFMYAIPLLVYLLIIPILQLLISYYDKKTNIKNK